jgi:hypothetical protein
MRLSPIAARSDRHAGDFLIGGDRLVAYRQNSLKRALSRHDRVHDLHRGDCALNALDGDRNVSTAEPITCASAWSKLGPWAGAAALAGDRMLALMPAAPIPETLSIMVSSS